MRPRPVSKDHRPLANTVQSGKPHTVIGSHLWVDTVRWHMILEARFDVKSRKTQSFTDVLEPLANSAETDCS
jgi:hypothetical protein